MKRFIKQSSSSLKPIFRRTFSTLQDVGPMASSSSKAFSLTTSAPSGSPSARRSPPWSLPMSRLLLPGLCTRLCSLLKAGSCLICFSTRRPELMRGLMAVGRVLGEVVLLADVDCSVLDELVDTFKKYRLRSKVDIENVGEEFSCWQRFGADHHKRQPSSLEDPQAASVGWGGAIDPTGSSSSQGNNTGLQWHKDPRLDCLGFRGIFPSNSIPPMVEADTETAEENYLLWRLERGVAEGSIEIPKGEAIPLEYNLAGLNAISFDKGCYIGQELIARSHHRGVIRKRLLPLKFLNESGTEVEQKVAPSSEVISLKSGKKAGTVTTALGSRGLGLLRLEDAFKESGNLVIKGQEDVKVEPIRPKWWPTEWFLEHEPHQAAG